MRTKDKVLSFKLENPVKSNTITISSSDDAAQ